MLIAVQNAQADLRAGFTAARDMSSHGNGYGDIEIRNAINEGRIDGPRYQVSTRGIVWGGTAESGGPGQPAGGGRGALRRGGSRGGARADCARRGLDQAVSRRRLFFQRDGAGPICQVTYPLPVLQALIDETHRLGKKAGCHVYGGEGQKNAIIAGCDTIEHGFGLNQEQIDMMVAKGLYYDPTLVRYMEPYMDDVDEKNTGGKFRIIPIFEKAARMAAATKGIQMMMGSGADGSTFPHGTQALEFEALVKRAGMTPARAIQAGTTVNAKVLGWQERDRIDREGQVRRSDCGFGRSAGRHHGIAACEVRDEGREDYSERFPPIAVTKSASYKTRRHRTGRFGRARRWPTTAD